MLAPRYQLGEGAQQHTTSTGLGGRIGGSGRRPYTISRATTRGLRANFYALVRGSAAQRSVISTSSTVTHWFDFYFVRNYLPVIRSDVVCEIRRLRNE